MNIILSIGAFNCLIFVLLLFSKSQKNNANKYLGALVLLVSVQLFLISFSSRTNYYSFPFLKISLMNIPFLFMPFLYFFCLKVIRPAFLFTKRQLLHFVPALLFTIASISVMMEMPEEFKTAIREGSYHTFEIISECTKVIQITIYLILCLKRTNHFNHDLKRKNLHTGQYQLNWLKNIILIAFAILVNGFIMGLLAFFSIIRFQSIDFPAYSYIPGVIWITWIGYKGLNYHPLINETDKCRQKYENSPVNRMAATEIVSKLKTYMDERKPYLDLNITLDQVSSDLGIKKQYLSQIINEYLKMNFYTYINQYRINEAKELLKCETHREKTIMSIAYQSGFNSKSTFNKLFKASAKQTPGQYRAQFFN